MTDSGGSSRANLANAPRKRFSLSGHSAKIDPRVDAVRPDLADVELADKVFAPHYAKAVAYAATADTDLMVSTKAGSELLVTLSANTPLELFDVSGGWAWVRARGQMGYVRSDMIAPR